MTDEAPRRGPYTDDDFRPFVQYDGKRGDPQTPPNFEELPIAEVAAAIISYGCLGDELGHFRPPGHTGFPLTARWFFRTTQGGSRDGEGYVIWSAGRTENPRPEAPYATVARGGRFALCKHEKIEDPGADHRRGWHPGRCRLCGIDMTVDSGD